MKFNWGTGIVLAFVGFIGFIMYFVIIAFSDKRADHQLVTPNYYQKELAYEAEIDAERNYKNLNHPILWNKTAGGLLLTFPKIQEQKNIQGTVSLYRPSSEQLDSKYPIQLSNHTLLIPEERLLEGRWDLEISWNYHGKAYLYKEKITY